ncbi:unnamed protein product, partial [Polarella glacialis]
MSLGEPWLTSRPAAPLRRPPSHTSRAPEAKLFVEAQASRGGEQKRTLCGKCGRWTLLLGLASRAATRRGRRCIAHAAEFQSWDDEEESVNAGDDDEDADGSDGSGQRERYSHGISCGSWASIFQKEGFDWSQIAGRTEKGPKSNVALIIGYDGSNFKGLQQISNPSRISSRIQFSRVFATVESELELALLKAGAMLPSNFGNLEKLRWTRAGRTDAGVSAGCNVVTARLIVGDGETALDDLVERVNSFLPPEVLLHSAAVVTSRFSARDDGSRRSYRFFVPSFAVVPSIDAMRCALAAINCQDPRGLGFEELKTLEDLAGLRQARVSAETLRRLREALSCFEGTHYFANFANAGLGFQDRQAFRTLRSISCDDPFVDENGREWLSITVCADSFLTHQIRKMIATAAQVAQGSLPLDFIKAALNCHVVACTPRFPPVGLIFLRPYFEGSQRGKVLEETLSSEKVEARIATWVEQLRVAVMKEAIDTQRWVKWLACAVAW